VAAEQAPWLQLRERHEPRAVRLPQISLVCFALGVCCVVGAAVLGIVYRTDTLVDWQAVQVWRIEWLLASLAAFLAGILLKKTR
jgi:hypothetical protein